MTHYASMQQFVSYSMLNWISHSQEMDRNQTGHVRQRHG